MKFYVWLSSKFLVLVPRYMDCIIQLHKMASQEGWSICLWFNQHGGRDCLNSSEVKVTCRFGSTRSFQYFSFKSNKKWICFWAWPGWCFNVYICHIPVIHSWVFMTQMYFLSHTSKNILTLGIIIWRRPRWVVRARCLWHRNRSCWFLPPLEMPFLRRSLFPIRENRPYVQARANWCPEVQGQTSHTARCEHWFVELLSLCSLFGGWTTASQISKIWNGDQFPEYIYIILPVSIALQYKICFRVSVKKKRVIHGLPYITKLTQ